MPHSESSKHKSKHARDGRRRGARNDEIDDDLEEDSQEQEQEQEQNDQSVERQVENSMKGNSKEQKAANGLAYLAFLLLLSLAWMFIFIFIIVFLATLSEQHSKGECGGGDATNEGILSAVLVAFTTIGGLGTIFGIVYIKVFSKWDLWHPRRIEFQRVFDLDNPEFMGQLLALLARHALLAFFLWLVDIIAWSLMVVYVLRVVCPSQSSERDVARLVVYCIFALLMMVLSIVYIVHFRARLAASIINHWKIIQKSGHLVQGTNRAQDSNCCTRAIAKVFFGDVQRRNTSTALAAPRSLTRAASSVVQVA